MKKKLCLLYYFIHTMMINNLCFHVPCNPAFYEAKESYDEVCLEATIYFEIIDLQKSCLKLKIQPKLAY